MDPSIALLVLLVVVAPIVLVIWLISRAVSARNQTEELSRRVGRLEAEVLRLTAKNAESASDQRAAPADAPVAQTRIHTLLPKPAPAVPHAAPEPILPPQPAAAKPVQQASPLIAPQPPRGPFHPPEAAPPPIARPAAKPIPAINWEQFMGVKLFAWVGGLALFLGVAFFVKYSFDNNLVSPELRVASGFVAGLGLLVGGVMMSQKKYAVLSQTLCATGVVILYAVTFSCRSIYHFQFFGAIPTFLVMALITITAFLLAVRLDALVVAILGMLGGFLTPILISTGQNNPAGLFGYIAILDAGLVVVALNKRWHFLAALAALGTALMEIAWASDFFESGKYFEGNKILVPLTVLLGFCALFLAGTWWSQRRKQANWWQSGSALGLVAVAFAFTAWFLDFPPLAQRPWLMFSFVFLVDLAATGTVWLDDNARPALSFSGYAVFALLGFWTAQSLSNDLLNAALAFYLLFAIAHSIVPELLKRLRHGTAPMRADHLFPILALVLVLVPIFKLAEVSFIVWPFILLVDLLAIVLAVLTTTLLPVLAVLLLTLAATGALIFKIPATLTGLPTSFFLLGAFVVFFVMAGVWLARKFNPQALKTGAKLGGDMTTPADLAVILPACSAVLPFLLLIMTTQRLALVDPSPVFGLALLLAVLLLGITKLFSMDWMPAIGLVCVTALECAWHFNRFDVANPAQPLNTILAWYLIFFAVFALFPFLFLRKFTDKVVPWAAAAMAGPAQFFLIHRFMKAAHPNPEMGLLPAAFAIPALVSLIVVLKQIPAAGKARITQLAWFGGVALFFITLIFPIQFDRQWITIGWALEGAALLWLFHRVPHPGLKLAGAGLLTAAFVRLALNPAVLDYHARSATPIFNWYLYAYGIVTLCLFAGARLMAPPRNIILKSDVPPILAGLGTVLAFLLLNIEISDYFSEPGSTLTFKFSGNFARDMTYSIAWALFSLVLLIVGMVRRLPPARYAAMGLLCVTLLKLFFHDLAQLDQRYRIGAFIGVAIIAMLASFAYQRFYAADLKQKESSNEAGL